MLIRIHRATFRGGRESGFAMLAIILLIAMLGTYAIVRALNRTSTDLVIGREQRTMEALRQAKASLIAYAASEEWQLYKGQVTKQPGGLPCPDLNDDGSSQGICSSALSRIGRLPWASIGADDLRDASGERLWYAVSSSFYRASGTTVINSDTQGMLTVTGTAPASNVVAIVFAPGPAIQGQNRPAATTDPAHNNPANYLEGFAASANDYTFTTTALPSDTFNDRLLIITQADLMAAVEPVVAARIERDIKPYLQTYFTQWGAFPFPARFVNPSPGTSGSGTTRPQSAFLGDTAQTNGGLLPVSATTISAASNASPIRITTNLDHGFSTGANVSISGVVGNTAANGNWIITVTDSTHFTLNGSTGNGSYSSGGVVTLPYAWVAGSGSVTQTGGAGIVSSTPSCATSGTSWQCVFNASGPDCGSASCTTTLALVAEGQVSNAGLTFANAANFLVPAGNVMINQTVLASPAATLVLGLAATGNGRVLYSATIQYSYSCSLGICGSVAVTITIPMNPANISASALTNESDPQAGWFIANEWYRQIYYAVSPGYLPGGSGACSPLPGTPSCLTVNNLPSSYAASNDKRAILVLAGRALDGSARPSATLSNYLEGQNATPADFIYEHRQGTPTSINDRVVVISP